MLYIYGLPLNKVLLTMLLSAVVWSVFLLVLPKRVLRFCSILILLFSLWAIIHYSVASRAASDLHIFLFSTTFDALGEEFYREMVMNLFLYFPLGVSLSFLIGPCSILAAFALPLSIESWQYFAGTGLAQGTDVICNTLGCAIGALQYLIVKFLNRK